MLSVDMLSKILLFQGVRSKNLLDIHRASQLGSYKRDSFLFNSEVVQKPYFYYILKGWVKLFTLSLGGAEIIRDILTNTHHFNEALLFKDTINSLNAQAISDVEALIVPIELLKKVMTQDIQFSVNLLRETLQKQRELISTIEHFSIQNATQRMGCFFLRLCPAGKTREIKLHLPYDKLLIAARLGMRPETFSRALAKLSKLCHIEIDGKMVYIPDPSFLIQYVCNQCSLDYPCYHEVTER